jgi:hypothetical protein
VVLAGAALAAAGEDFGAVVRSVAEKVRKSIVVVQVETKVIQGRAPGMPAAAGFAAVERKEALGTVVDPSGLTVASMCAVDPETFLKATSDLTGMEIGGKQPKLEVETEILRASILLEDGATIPADVVYEDDDLDFVFVRPKEAGRTLEAVSLKPRGVPLQLAERVFAVGRLGRLGQRSLAVVTGMVRALLPGPHPAAVCSQEISDCAGCLAFAEDGAPVGLFVKKYNAEKDPTKLMSLFTGEGKEDFALPVLRPVEDVLAALENAKQSRGPIKIEREVVKPPILPLKAAPPKVGPVAPPPPPDKAAPKKGETPPEW